MQSGNPSSRDFPSTVLVPVSVDNGQSAGLQLFQCKTGYFLFWEEFLFGVGATTGGNICTDSERATPQNKTGNYGMTLLT